MGLAVTFPGAPAQPPFPVSPPASAVFGHAGSAEKVTVCTCCHPASAEHIPSLGCAPVVLDVMASLATCGVG